jgi:hypothetical protein
MDTECIRSYWKAKADSSTEAKKSRMKSKSKK